jgi:hypothetical protein
MKDEELVPSVSISNLINQRDAIVERLEQIALLHLEIEELSQAAFGNDDAAPALECRYCHASVPNIEPMVKRVDAAAWDFLMNESGLRTFMDAESREQWAKDLYERQVPALTHDSGRETFKSLYDHRLEMFERGVVQCFRKLSWDYKTNNPYLFGKRHHPGTHTRHLERLGYQILERAQPHWLEPSRRLAPCDAGPRWPTRARPPPGDLPHPE